MILRRKNRFENKIIEVEAKVEQCVEVEQSENFLSTLVEKGFFDMELDSPDIPIVVPTKV
jgi:hypothetical protein